MWVTSSTKPEPARVLSLAKLNEGVIVTNQELARREQERIAKEARERQRAIEEPNPFRRKSEVSQWFAASPEVDESELSIYYKTYTNGMKDWVEAITKIEQAIESNSPIYLRIPEHLIQAVPIPMNMIQQDMIQGESERTDLAQTDLTATYFYRFNSAEKHRLLTYVQGQYDSFHTLRNCLTKEVPELEHSEEQEGASAQSFGVNWLMSLYRGSSALASPMERQISALIRERRAEIQKPNPFNEGSESGKSFQELTDEMKRWSIVTINTVRELSTYQNSKTIQELIRLSVDRYHIDQNIRNMLSEIGGYQEETE